MFGGQIDVYYGLKDGLNDSFISFVNLRSVWEVICANSVNLTVFQTKLYEDRREMKVFSLC